MCFQLIAIIQFDMNAGAILIGQHLVTAHFITYSYIDHILNKNNKWYNTLLVFIIFLINSDASDLVAFSNKVSIHSTIAVIKDDVVERVPVCCVNTLLYIY